MTRFGLVAPPPRPDPKDQIEYLAWFRFPVTWAYLSGPAPAVEPELRNRPVVTLVPEALTLASAISAPPPASPAINPGISGGDARPAAAAQWEMVIPKMVRPTAKPVVDRIPAAPAPVPMLSAPAPTSVAPVEHNAPEVSAPSLLLMAPDDPFLVRYWRKIALVLAAILAIGLVFFGRFETGASATHERAAESASVGGWSRRTISPPGRMMSVYEPSRDESDYRIEFGWVPDAIGVGWVFRTLDANDYYATRLTLLQPGANLVLAAEHFSVSGGIEGAHSRKVIPLANNAGLVRVRMDAVGPAFTLSLQGSPVDYWNDARLGSGALGFYDEAGQRPEVQSLRFTFIKKGATRTAGALLP